MKSLLLAAVVATTTIAHADVSRPRDVLHFMRPASAPATPQADSHIIFLNNCMPNGCAVTTGQTDARYDTSDIAQQNGTLSAWTYGQPAWNQTVQCVRDTFSRWNVTITDVDPGTTPHYEVMVAGSPQQILGSQGLGVGGVADFPCMGVGQCSPYLPNALVFAFAGVFGPNPTEICAVAAQEIAHTWALDHVVDATDPLTYNQYSGMRTYHDHEKCGSDCQGGKSPFGLPCTGSGGQASHVCSGNNQATQNEVEVITSLFGPSGTATPPSVAITAPADGASVTPKFVVTADVTDTLGVVKAELRIDGVLVGTVETPPFTWTTPVTLAYGSHQVEVTGYDDAGLTSKSAITIDLGKECSKPSDCPVATDTCVDEHCVPGQDVPGGLGTPCTTADDCASHQCANDGTNHFCVETCDPAKQGCPAGFGCQVTGASGVCWPAAGGGSGGCNTGGSGGAIVLGLGFAGLLVMRRKR